MQKIPTPHSAKLYRTLCNCSIALLVVVIFGRSAIAQNPNPTPVPPQQQTPLPLLTNGEHLLNGGETQSYQVALTAGQFLHVLVDQNGIDVVVTSFAPDGRQLTQIDSPNGRWGSESVLLVAESSGDYRIEVRSTNVRVEAGRYAIQVVGLRDATALDQQHAAAGRAWEEGNKLSTQSEAAAQRSAIEKFDTAASLFKTAHDPYRQAMSLLRGGRAYVQLGEVRKALPYFEETIRLAHELEDVRLEAGAETFVGGIRDVLGDIGQALNHYDRALKLSRQTGSKLTEASALNNIGKIFGDSSDWQKSLDYYRQALTLYRENKSRQQEAITLNNIGVTYLSSGEPEKALEYLEQSLPLLRAGNDRNAEAYTISNIGNVYYRLGKNETALDFLAQARAIQQQTGNRAREAETLDLIGLVTFALGQPEKALEFHQRALDIQRTTGNLRREAIALSSLGNVYNQLHQYDKALEQLNRSASLYRSLGDLNGLAVTLERTAVAQRASGDITVSRKSIEESLQLIETVRARSASQQLRASYFASREQAYEFYVDLLMQQHAREPARGHDAEALRAVERGRARSLLEMLTETSVDVRKGIDAALLERERNLAQSLNAKAQRQIQLLAAKGSAEEIEILKKEISALEDDYQQVQAAIRKSSPAYAALTQPQPLGLSDIQKQLDPNTLLLEYSLGDERSYLWVVSKDSLKTFLLPPRENIQKGARRVYDLLTTRSQLKAGETVVDKKQRIAKADVELTTSINELSELILAPAARDVEGKRLAIVADGALQFVPFGALSLSKGSRPLIADHEIITLPSASALAVQRQNLAQRKPAPYQIAMIADPVFSAVDDRLNAGQREGSSRREVSDTRIIEHIADDPSGKTGIRRLRFTRQEAEQILAVAPRRTNLKALDFKANRSIATSGDLSQYRYVHFATHGYIDSERPDLSAVVLSLVDENGNPQDGFLRAHDIYNLNLPAELVVLSACQTGLGKEIKGEGLVGLTRGFMYAGARRLVVSLWNVNDKATAELMRRFYRGMLKEGLTPAAALRQAQSEMSQHSQWSAPYYWAAFVLQGEWR